MPARLWDSNNAAKLLLWPIIALDHNRGGEVKVSSIKGILIQSRVAT